MSDTDTMTLGLYLSNYSTKRNIDKVIKKWFIKNNKANTVKTKAEWDEVVKSFYSETETY